MKNVLFFMVLTGFVSCAKYISPYPRHEYIKQITFENMTADQIFNKVEMWFAKTFVDSRSVLELKSREGKQFYGNGIIRLIGEKYFFSFNCTFEIYIRDNQLKCTISNIDFIDPEKTGFYVYKHYEFLTAKSKQITDERIDQLMIDLENSIKKQVW